MRRSRKIILLAALACLGSRSIYAETPSKELTGKWKHTSRGITLTIEANRLHIVREGETPLSLHADYAITQDQTVYGLITRVEGAVVASDRDGEEGLLDTPFCFRVRAEDGCLVIRELKTAAKVCGWLEGVYKPAAMVAAGKPEPKTDKTTPRRKGEAAPGVPSCSLYGDHLVNFALADVEGNAWEYQSHKRGRLMLLDFWYHSSAPCLQTIPHLVSLQRDYGPYGLDVVGIACETGPMEEQRRNLRALRGRYHINFTSLLSGARPGKPSPVMTQFQADYFPLLVLIDQSGKIIWHSNREGMDDPSHEVLRRMISDRLIKQSP